MQPIQPPFSVKLFKERVVVTVTLHKIPDQFITVDATATHFHLDTSKYSKKFLLEFPYPEGVTVNSDKADAALDHGILKVTLPIASRPPRADAEAAAAGQSEVSAAPTGNKGKKRGAETQQPPPSDSAKPAARPEKKAKTAPAAALPAAAAAAAGDESSSKVKPKKKAKFIEQSAALALVDAVNDSVDENVQKQVDTDAAKKKAIQAVQAQKKEKKKEKSDFLEKIQQEKKKRLLQKQRSEIDAPRPAPKKK